MCFACSIGFFSRVVSKLKTKTVAIRAREIGTLTTLVSTEASMVVFNNLITFCPIEEQFCLSYLIFFFSCKWIVILKIFLLHWEYFNDAQSIWLEFYSFLIIIFRKELSTFYLFKPDKEFFPILWKKDMSILKRILKLRLWHVFRILIGKLRKKLTFVWYQSG